MSRISEILLRMPRYRKTGKHAYMCACPAHQDKTASLAVKETEDGRILIHCFAGCGATEVLDAIGMDWDALFPDTYKTFPREKNRVNFRDCADQLTLEGAILLQYANMVAKGEAINRESLLKCVSSISRIHNLMEGR